jgi:hypothetical protein
VKQRVSFVLRAFLALVVVASLLSIPLLTAQAALPISVVVKSVVFDSKVMATVTNLPVDETFTVRMGASGKQGLDGNVVASFDTTKDTPVSREMLFEIPTNLFGKESIDLRIDSLDSKVSGYTTFANHPIAHVSSSGVGGIPTLAVLSVKSDSNVTVQIGNLPVDVDFTVRMGKSGTQGFGGPVSAGFNSGKTGGTLVQTFSIPVSLMGEKVIDIRIDALGRYYASTSFSNPVVGSLPAAGVGGASSLVVTSVIGKSMVSFVAYNLPGDTTFTVRIGKDGTQGMGGNVVAKFDVDVGGTFNNIVEIPSNLYSETKLVLRVEASGGYAIYTTFSNVTTP